MPLAAAPHCVCRRAARNYYGGLTVVAVRGTGYRYRRHTSLHPTGPHSRPRPAGRRAGTSVGRYPRHGHTCSVAEHPEGKSSAAAPGSGPGPTVRRPPGRGPVPRWAGTRVVDIPRPHSPSTPKGESSAAEHPEGIKLGCRSRYRSGPHWRWTLPGQGRAGRVCLWGVVGTRTGKEP